MQLSDFDIMLRQI